MAVLKTIPCQNNPFLEFPPHLSMLLMVGEKCILINFYNDFEELEKMGIDIAEFYKEHSIYMLKI